RRTPVSTLFPYTTLFRSSGGAQSEECDLQPNYGRMVPLSSPALAHSRQCLTSAARVVLAHERLASLHRCGTGARVNLAGLHRCEIGRAPCREGGRRVAAA